MEPRKLEELLEACRPDSNDLHASEMRALADCVEQDPAWRQRYERVQRLDSAISTTLHQVPVPPNLKQRLLAAAAARPAAAESVERPSATPALQAPQLESSSPEPSQSVVGRRRLLAAVVSLAVAASLGGVLLVGWWNREPVPITGETLAEAALQTWRYSLEPDRWEPVPHKVQAVYPIDPNLSIQPRAFQWYTATGEPLSGQRGVAYRSNGPNKPQTLLFVLQATGKPMLPTLPPSEPDRTTGGWYAAAWRRNQHLYVLAVEGSLSDYQKIIQAKPPQLAMWMR